ncbi:MAG: type II secretion system F family protein [Betaproteobacteria bacterium]
MTTGEALFEVVAVAPNGALQTRRVAAPSEQQAAQQVRLDGARVLACRGIAPPRRGVARMAPRRAAALDLGLFSEELAALLDAGLGIVDAIRTLALKERHDAARRALERIAHDLSEGLPLSKALARQPETFPPLLTAAAAASEQTGDLVPALRRYAAHLETLQGLRSKVVGAAIYPALLLAVGTLVVMFLLGVVVPRFAQLLEGAQRDLPFASSVLLGWGKAVAAHPAVFLALAATTALGLATAGVRLVRSGWQVRGLQRVWVIGPLARLFRHAQFYRTSAMLVQGGIPALRAFTMSRSLLTPEDQARLDGATSAIAEGRRIGPALAAATIADPVALRMLEVAQRTGRLPEALARIAGFQEAQLARAVALATRLIEPALMIAIGLVIGAIVVLMYLPIFDLASSLQ